MVKWLHFAGGEGHLKYWTTQCSRRPSTRVPGEVEGCEVIVMGDSDAGSVAIWGAGSALRASGLTATVVQVTGPQQLREAASGGS